METLDETQTNSRTRIDKTFDYEDKVEESEPMLVFRKDNNHEENDYQTEQELINSKEHTEKGDKFKGDYFSVNEEGNETNNIIHF